MPHSRLLFSVILCYNADMRNVFRVLKCVGIALLSVTWCVLQTLIGAVLFLVFLPGGRVTTYRGMLIVYHRYRISFSLGVFSFISNKADNARFVRSHMFGHFLQSCIFGPIYLFAVVLPQLILRIPSVKRRRLERGKTPDDAIFERKAIALATRAGE